MTKKICIIFCTCSRNPNQGNAWKISTLQNLFSQTSEKYEYTFVSSDCCSHPDNRNNLINFNFDGRGFDYINHIDTPISLQMSLNHTIKKVHEIDPHDYYIMWSSDTGFLDPYAIQKIINELDNDDSIFAPGWKCDLAGPPFGEAHKYKPDVKKTILPIGYGFNGIFVGFSKYHVEKYNLKPYSDVVLTNCGECMLTYQAAAIKKHQSIINYVCLEEKMCPPDGSSNLFMGRRENLVRTLNLRGPSGELTLWDNSKYNFKEMVEGGLKYGLGYQEMDANQWWLHDPNCYDENYFCTNDDLYHYIKNNWYIKKEDFDYDANHGEFRRL